MEFIDAIIILIAIYYILDRLKKLITVFNFGELDAYHVIISGLNELIGWGKINSETGVQ